VISHSIAFDMAAFRELAAFAQFGSDLDKATQARLEQGRRLREILKQPQFSPVPIANQIILIYAATKGYADQVDITRMVEWESELIRYIETNHPDLIETILQEREITEAIESKMSEVLESFSL
jgi:F-type H+-transporting ATPase subunit alpha